MTYKFSETSLRRLQACHPDIQTIMHEVIRVSEHDMTIVCGRRGEREQEEAFKNGNSRARYGESPHNCDPSMAVDVAPYMDGRIQWNNDYLWAELAGTIKAVNMALIEDGKVSHTLRWGNDWDGDGIPVARDPDESFVDSPHFEIRGWKELEKKDGNC